MSLVWLLADGSADPALYQVGVTSCPSCGGVTASANASGVYSLSWANGMYVVPLALSSLLAGLSVREPGTRGPS